MEKINFDYLHHLKLAYDDIFLFAKDRIEEEKQVQDINALAKKYIEENEKAIVGHFKVSIDYATKYSILKSQKIYEHRIKLLKENYLPDEFNIELEKFYMEIKRNLHKDKSLYNRLIAKENSRNFSKNQFALDLYSELQNLNSPIRRIIEILDFEDNTASFLANQKILENRISSKKPTLTHYALFYYFIHESREERRFDNHPEGKVAALKELISKNKVPTKSYKTFQLKYNQISKNRMNRIASSEKKNLAYVIKNMLNEYPKAKKIAIEEYELDVTK